MGGYGQSIIAETSSACSVCRDVGGSGWTVISGSDAAGSGDGVAAGVCGADFSASAGVFCGISTVGSGVLRGFSAGLASVLSL